MSLYRNNANCKGPLERVEGDPGSGAEPLNLEMHPGIIEATDWLLPDDSELNLGQLDREMNMTMNGTAYNGNYF